MSEGGGGGGNGAGWAVGGAAAGAVAVGAAARIEMRLALTIQKSADHFDAAITLKSRSGTATKERGGKFSMFALLRMATLHGDTIWISAEGPDEEEALEALTHVIANADLVADRLGIPRYDEEPPEALAWVYDERTQMRGQLTLEEALTLERSLGAADRRKLGTVRSEEWWRLTHLPDEERAEELAAIADPSPPEDHVTLGDVWFNLPIRTRLKFRRLSKVEQLNVEMMRGPQLRTYLEGM